MIRGLVRHAETVLPDRLAGIPGLGTHAVDAHDSTYAQPSADFRQCPPRNGGDHKLMGHGLLTFYNLRRGVPVDGQLEVRNRQEITVVRDYDQSPHAQTQRRNALFVVDRAFIDAPFWDVKQAKLGITLIIRMKANLRIDSIKAIRRQARHQAMAPHQPDGADRPLWTVPVFGYTTKVSRQVLRFFKHGFLRPATPVLYQRELRSLLMAYL